MNITVMFCSLLNPHSKPHYLYVRLTDQYRHVVEVCSSPFILSSRQDLKANVLCEFPRNETKKTLSLKILIWVIMGFRKPFH